MERTRKQNGSEMRLYRGVADCELAHGLALLGATDSEMARVMKIATTTLDKWKRVHTELKEAIDAGKDEADVQVARAFFLSCIGQWVEEEEARVIKGVLQVVTVRRWIAGDKWAQARWLGIRQRDKWSETHRVDINQHINITQLSARLEQLPTDDLTMLEQISTRLRELPTMGGVVEEIKDEVMRDEVMRDG